MSPAQYVSVSLATCVGLCRFGEAWAALRAENLLTYLLNGRRSGRSEASDPGDNSSGQGRGTWYEQVEGGVTRGEGGGVPLGPSPLHS